jgi:hypothetical protein
VDLDDFASVRAFDLKDRLFGFEFENILAGRESVPLFHQDLADVGRVDVLTEIWNPKFDRHG